MSIKEFKPTIFFLLRFVGFYLAANLIYGIYITSYEPAPDPITHSVTVQAGIILNICGYRVEVTDRADKPTTDISYFGKSKLAVYEGCNGLNAMIIFVAFLVALGPWNRHLAWFTALGLLIIHFTNLCRIVLLFFVSEHIPKAMYFTHKYFFTIVLYVVIFAFWWWWISRFAFSKRKAAV